MYFTEYAHAYVYLLICLSASSIYLLGTCNPLTIVGGYYLQCIVTAIMGKKNNLLAFKGLDSLVEKWYIRVSQRDKEDEGKIILKASGLLFVDWIPFLFYKCLK